jgi:uncharacterized membrane protein
MSNITGRYGVQPGAAGPAPVRRRRAAGLWLIGAVVTVGLMAGLFVGFSMSVMPGLGRSDDRTFVTAMQHINEAIQNPLFGLIFVGALGFPVVAMIVLFAQRQGAAARWTLAALLLYVVALFLTMGIEVPLNDKLAQAGAPDQIKDLHAVRSSFEGTWVMVNHIRGLACTVAVACLGRALVLHGRDDR